MRRYSDMHDLCNYIFQNISVIGYSPVKFYREVQKNEKDADALKENLESQKAWFKSFLYERKEIEVSDMWNKRENGNLDFEGAGKILSSHTIYSEDLETFIYNSN